MAESERKVQYYTVDDPISPYGGQFKTYPSSIQKSKLVTFVNTSFKTLHLVWLAKVFWSVFTLK